MSSSDSDEYSNEPISNDEEGLAGQIVKSFQKSAFDKHKPDFLPEGCLDNLITEAAVTRELAVTKQSKESRKAVYFILKEAKKVFAILLVSRFEGKKLLGAITLFRRSKLGDTCLPVREGAESNVPFFRNPTKPWDTVSIRTFCKEQRAFLAHVFSGDNLNLRLDDNDILPFICQGSNIVSGAFGDVHQVTVHEKHHKNPIFTVRHL